MEERVMRYSRRRRGGFSGGMPELLAGAIFAVLLPLAGAALLMWGPAGRRVPAPAAPEAPAAVVSPAGEDEAAAPWNLLLVNSENPIPEGLEVELAEVPGGEKVDARVYQPLMELLEAAREGNWDRQPLVVSGYRTWEKQQSLFDEKAAKYRDLGYSEEAARAEAAQWVAAPGYSEHQAGLAVDINGATYDVYFWLQENSWKYGFIFRYSGDKTDLTGVAEEVWHYRYVGREAAETIHQRGLCLEEYLAEQEAAA